jgi:hypothetical protein
MNLRAVTMAGLAVVSAGLAPVAAAQDRGRGTPWQEQADAYQIRDGFRMNLTDRVALECRAIPTRDDPGAGQVIVYLRPNRSTGEQGMAFVLPTQLVSQSVREVVVRLPDGRERIERRVGDYDISLPRGYNTFNGVFAAAEEVPYARLNQRQRDIMEDFAEQVSANQVPFVAPAPNTYYTGEPVPMSPESFGVFTELFRGTGLTALDACNAATPRPR